MIDFKNELIKNCERGETNVFLSESLSENEMIQFCNEHKDDVMNEEFNFEVETSDYFTHTFENEDFDVVYLKYKTVYLFGCNVTMHLLNDEFMQSEATIIYQIEK